MDTPLWTADASARWTDALARYGEVIAAQGVSSLPAHDAWYQHELPSAISARETPLATHPELVRLTEWKMARGEWRARNLVLVRGNSEREVERVTAEALALAPHPTKPIAMIATLAGVGPATASAVLAAYMPSHYPFFDELVAAQVPTLGPVRWTLGYYARYAEALRDRAVALGGAWTPAMIERALWAYVGGKAAHTGR
jgi:hypothetical protein